MSGKRIRLDQPAGHGIESCGGNDAARERSPAIPAGRSGGRCDRERIVNRAHTGKVPAPHRNRRHGIDGCERALPLPEALVVGEEEKFVMPDGSAQACAELVLLILRLGRPRLREEVSRVEPAVAEELVRAAPERIRSGLRDHIDRRARVPSLFCLEQVRLNLELQHRFHRWPQSDQAVAPEIVVHAVQHEVVRLFPVPVRKQLRPGPHVVRPRSASDGARCRVSHSRHPRPENRQLGEVSPIQRQVAHRLRLDHVPDGGRIRFQQRRRRSNLYRFAHLARGQREVDLCDLVQFQPQFLSYGLLESWLSPGNRVPPGRQQGNVVVAGLVRHRLSFRAVIEVGDDDFCGWHDRAAGIGYDPLQAGRCLSKSLPPGCYECYKHRKQRGPHVHLSGLTLERS